MWIPSRQKPVQGLAEKKALFLYVSCAACCLWRPPQAGFCPLHLGPPFCLLDLKLQPILPRFWSLTAPNYSPFWKDSESPSCCRSSCMNLLSPSLLPSTARHFYCESLYLCVVFFAIPQFKALLNILAVPRNAFPTTLYLSSAVPYCCL